MKPKASTQLSISMSLIILIIGVLSIVVVNWEIKKHAVQEATEKARIILDRNIATHTYYNHQLKPTLFQILNPIIDEKYFDPKWMSSTYAVREIDKYYQELSDRNYYYKEAAINARSPENEANDFERSFIKKINESDTTMDISEVIDIEGEPFFVVLRRGEVMEQSCLRCHSTPAAAPTGLVSVYGDKRSFERSLGETISTISIRIPLARAYEEANQLIWKMSGLIVLALLAVFGVTFYLNNRLIFMPLNIIRQKAIDVGNEPEHLGEQIELPESFELSELTEALNSMSISLLKEHENLELRVKERTEELNEAYTRIKKEVGEHKNTIRELEEAMSELKILKGIIPICMHCKGIRDDQGDWNQLEAYISEHSDAHFSHGLCDKCLDKYYPDEGD